MEDFSSSLEKAGVKLMQGDCLELLQKVDDGSIDMVFTDPPYKVTSRGGHTSAGGMMLDKKMRSGKVFKYNSIKPETWLKEVVRVLSEGAHAYIMTNNKNIHEYLGAVKESGLTVVKCLIWVKDNKIMSQAYMSQFEYIIFARKGKFKRINHCGTSDVLQYNNVRNKRHPTEKPVDMIETIIANSTKEGEVVLDLFMGAGSTGVAAKNLNRKFVGVEIDPSYYDIAVDRIINT